MRKADNDKIVEDVHEILEADVDETEANEVVEAGNIVDGITDDATPRRSRRANKGQTSKYEDFEHDIPEQLLLSSIGVPSSQVTPVTSEQERSLDWDNYALDPTFLARLHNYQVIL